MIPQHLIDIIITVVLLIWISVSAKAIFFGDYEGLQIITPVAIVVVTAAVGVPLLRRKNGTPKA